MSAKSEHRAAAAELHRGDSGMVRCVLSTTEGHECSGRLECHHVIEAQRLAKLWQRADFYSRNPSPKMEEPAYYARMRETSSDALIADGRNSAWVCTLGHRQIELGRFPLPRLPLVEAFARDYAIEHEVPVWADEIEEAA